jgi:hypothetical protein
MRAATVEDVRDALTSMNAGLGKTSHRSLIG